LANKQASFVRESQTIKLRDKAHLLLGEEEGRARILDAGWRHVKAGSQLQQWRDRSQQLGRAARLQDELAGEHEEAGL